MSSRARLLLLAALSGGALIVGVELMITAVALPSILQSLADWTQLRRASWIVNAYLLAYIATMPLAGRAADRFGLPRLFMLALGLFAVGSALSGVAQSLDQLIAARVIQGVGGGAIVPLATAGASLLYEGPARSRALGIVGACTFLGMAIGPFAGASVLQVFDFSAAFADAGRTGSLVASVLTPSWRWVFFVSMPMALVALLYVWAAAPSWPSQERRGGIDAIGAGLFTAFLASGVLALTSLGDPAFDAIYGRPLYVAICAVSGTLAAARFLRARDPFLDLHMFRNRVFSGAVLVSLLTGYGLATALIGAAVYVDRVRYAGPDEQRLVLGALALATAIGALGSGFALRLVPVVPLSLFGLAFAVGGLLVLAGTGPVTPISTMVLGLAVFGLGFGVTVTPRSTAAVEALGRRAFGMASAGVTVARMAGMAIGLAVLTGFGSQRIAQLGVVLSDQAARDAVLPPELRGRSLEDGLVVAALERWAAGEAATILAGLFIVAAVVTALAAIPTLAMLDRSLRSGRATIERESDARSGGDGDDTTRPAPAF
jgi:MFS family permease